MKEKKNKVEPEKKNRDTLMKLFWIKPDIKIQPEYIHVEMGIRCFNLQTSTVNVYFIFIFQEPFSFLYYNVILIKLKRIILILKKLYQYLNTYFLIFPFSVFYFSFGCVCVLVINLELNQICGFNIICENLF